ncbi:hypothetical protein G4B88_011231 [Cannabis sativa]|uniref:Ubiquitin-like protease family profile domain-containing protein n=1 Tax=Cannabis sativa TaxID=3483 RepID=A0A7J6GBB1_CANSA|nr:hypothetical protein G4B88_011231 [Cannabis sativa]
MKSVAEMNKKLDILIESSHGSLTHNGSQSEDALRTSENEDDEDSTSEEDEDDKFDDDKGDDHDDDETDDDDDDDDLGGDGVGAGQDEAHTGDVVSRDDDTGKVDDAKNSDPVEPLAEIKQPEQSQGGEENIDVDATIASAVKAVENLIGSSTHVPASVETYEKTDLEMVVFQETPILRPQKRDRKKGAVLKSPFIELASGASKSGSSSVSPDDSVYKVVKYVRGLCPLDNKIGEPVDPQLEAEFVKWVDTGLRKHKSNTTTNVYCKGKDTIFPPFRFGVEDISDKMWFHNLAYPNCFLTNSVNFKGLRNEAKFSTMEPFPIVDVDGLPEQVTADCGVFVASFAEYFIDGKPIPSSDFDVEIHRDRLAVLFYQYGMKKQTENIESESEAPPSLPKK